MEKESTLTVESAPMESTPAVPCVICGAFVDLNERERGSLLVGHVPTKVCKECKMAVAFMKNVMKNSV